ncbi:hypothetical protein D3C76_1448930 [compost metagenome]
MLQVLRQPEVERSSAAVFTAQVKLQAFAAQRVQRALSQRVEFYAHNRAVERLGCTDVADGEGVEFDLRACAVLAGDTLHRVRKQPRTLGHAV